MAQKKTASGSKGSSSREKKGIDSDARQERHRKGVEIFDRAIKNLHKGDLTRAKGQFADVASTYPEQRDLLDRSRCYLAICERQAKASSPDSPRGFEEVVAHGVFSHNQGDYKLAIELLSKAVEMEPKSDHAHYCLAAAFARDGDTLGASRHLTRAVNTNPYNLFLARSDDDFDSLRTDPSLAKLLAEEPP